MPIYRAEVTLSAVDVVGGTYGSFFTHSIGEAWMGARDPTNPGGRTFGIYYGYGASDLRTAMVPTDSDSSTGNVFADGVIIDPDTSSSYGIADTDTDQETYKAGGTLAIEKDTDAETITFICPFGSIVIPFADFTGTIDPDLPIAAVKMGHGFIHWGTDGSYEEARWTELRSYVDGDEFLGHALTSADPGTWGFWNDVSPSIAPPGGSTAGPPAVTENTQLLGGYKTRFRYNTADGVIQTHSRESRTLTTTEGASGIDTCRPREHPMLFQAAVMPFKSKTLSCRKTFIHGYVWERTTIYEEAGKVMESPSISYKGGVLNVFWTYDGVCYRSHSEDAGEHWTAPVTLAYSGSFPRHIVHPHHPFLLYFFFDGATLKVARSFDSGASFIDAAPIQIESGLIAQQIDAEWSHDGSVLVSYFNAGVWTQKRSRDQGLTWEL